MPIHLPASLDEALALAKDSWRWQAASFEVAAARDAVAVSRAGLKPKLSLGGAVYDPIDPVGRLLFNVLAMVAEFEADLIRLRTREGMKVAKFIRNGSEHDGKAAAEHMRRKWKSAEREIKTARELALLPYVLSPSAADKGGRGGGGRGRPSFAAPAETPAVEEATDGDVADVADVADDVELTSSLSTADE